MKKKQIDKINAKIAGMEWVLSNAPITDAKSLTIINTKMNQLRDERDK